MATARRDTTLHKIRNKLMCDCDSYMLEASIGVYKIDIDMTGQYLLQRSNIIIDGSF
jgi:hypothetical protein